MQPQGAIAGMKRLIRQLIRRLGFDIVRYRSTPPQVAPAVTAASVFPPDFDPEAIEIIQAVQPYTLTSPERIFALIQAVRYIVQARIPGAMVECGVWRGGSMMAVAHTLKRLGQDQVNLYLFDTYAGMPKPAEVDVDCTGQPALLQFAATQQGEDSSAWCYAPLAEVRQNMASTGYDLNRVKFIKGKVEETIPDAAPAQISLLRLDTDWYASTKHELTHLFPRLSAGGVLIVDDYGYWRGSRKAVDEYLAAQGLHLLLHRIDATGRIAIKPIPG